MASATRLAATSASNASLRWESGADMWQVGDRVVFTRGFLATRPGDEGVILATTGTDAVIVAPDIWRDSPTVGVIPGRAWSLSKASAFLQLVSGATNQTYAQLPIPSGLISPLYLEPVSLDAHPVEPVFCQPELYEGFTERYYYCTFCDHKENYLCNFSYRICRKP